MEEIARQALREALNADQARSALDASAGLCLVHLWRSFEMVQDDPAHAPGRACSHHPALSTGQVETGAAPHSRWLYRQQVRRKVFKGAVVVMSGPTAQTPALDHKPGTMLAPRPAVAPRAYTTRKFERSQTAANAIRLMLRSVGLVRCSRIQ